MEYYSDYHLDKILKEGVYDDNDFVSKIIKACLPGVPIDMDVEYSFGCSSFIGESDTSVLMGRNYDMFDADGVIVKTKPKNGYKSIGIVDMSYLLFAGDFDDGFINKIPAILAPYACMDGMNEKGFACSILLLDGNQTFQNTGKTPISTTLAIRMMLDKAATVDEAIALLEQYDMRASGGADFHFFLSDADGNYAIVEYPNSKMVVTRDVPVVTNYYICDIPDDILLGEGQDRAEAINKILLQSESMDIDKCFDALRAAEDKKGTQWSVVYDLTEIKAYIAYQRDWDSVFTIDLK